jgi:hypothetical protein
MSKTINAIILLALGLAACQNRTTVCPPATGTPERLSVSPDLIPTSTPGSGGRMEVVINGRAMLVDKVIEGPLCNETWSGIVYVGCNVQVYPWVDQPTFLKDCDLKMEPGTVVYVAYHNNSAYYNGCSCHISGTAEPNP